MALILKWKMKMKRPETYHEDEYGYPRNIPTKLKWYILELETYCDKLEGKIKILENTLQDKTYRM